VNEIGDADDFNTANLQANDGRCDTNDNVADGEQCTLRAAIQEANANDNFDDTTPVVDRVEFAPSFDGGATGGAAADTIVATSVGANIDEATVVDATDCAAAPDPCAGFQANGLLGLQVSGDNVEIRGLAITNGSTGLTVQGDNAKIAGNWFGLKLDETAQANDRGIHLEGNDADQNIIGGETAADRNVFAHNTSDGLRITGGDNNVVKGNYFGTKPDGTTAAGNGTGTGGDNIEISSIGGTAGPASGNTIGGTVTLAQLATPECDGACNVIASSTDGVDLVTEGGFEGSPAGSTTISGNFIGLDSTGNTALPNSTGIRVTVPGTGAGPQVVIGGATSADANFIVGGQVGIEAGTGTAQQLDIRNNFIGLNSAKTALLWSATTDVSGITFFSPAASNQTKIRDNHIAVPSSTGFERGIEGSGEDAEITNNKFGVSPSLGALEAGDIAMRLIESGSGVSFDDALIQGNTIGNVSGAPGDGISLEGGDDNVIKGNFIGTDSAGGSHPVGNAGITIAAFASEAATGNVIGGVTSAEENVLSNAAGDAIKIQDLSSAGNEIRRNRGRSNDDLFVDLNADGAGNPVTGPNGGVQAPTFGTPGSTSISGGAGSAEAGATVRVYKTFTETGDLKEFVDDTVAESDGSWEVTYSALPNGQCLTANQTTATSNNSSEFPTAKAVGGGVCDVTAPTATITSGPSGPTNDSTPTFEFSSNESGSTFECRFDSDAFGACSGGDSHTPASPLSEGPHTFEVRATDPVGNTGAPVSRDFTVDTTPPNTTITSGPAGGSTTNDPTPTFGFSSSGGGSGFQCQVDGGGFSACNSPFTTGALDDGQHTFQVRATDNAGNADTSPASRTFTVDTTPPNTTIDSGPVEGSTTNDSTPTFDFSSNEGGSSFQCRIDGGAFGPCSGPGSTHTPSSPLSDGQHTFDVRATDPVGNVEASPASRTFTVDTTVPPPPVEGGAPPPPDGVVPLPSNEFGIGKLNGLKLTLTVPGPGTVEVRDAADQSSGEAMVAATKTRLKPSSATALAAGEVTVKLKLTKKAKQSLKQRGAVKVNAAITYTPSGGSANTKTAKLKVKKKK
jgi:hypothetical protein